jgi:hypothetical protein
MAGKRKPGKYDHILPHLPPLPPGDAEYQMKVETEKERLRQCPECEGTGKREMSTSLARVVSDTPKDNCGFCGGTGRRRMDAQTIAALYIIARADVATVDAAAFRANLELEAVSQLLIANNDTKKDPAWGSFGASPNAIKLTDGDNIRLQGVPFPLPSDKAKFREWCFANGYRDKMVLPDKELSDLSKTRLLNGQPQPDGVKAYVRTTIVYTPLKTEVAADESKPTEDDAF